MSLHQHCLSLEWVGQMEIQGQLYVCLLYSPLIPFCGTMAKHKHHHPQFNVPFNIHYTINILSKHMPLVEMELTVICDVKRFQCHRPQGIKSILDRSRHC